METDRSQTYGIFLSYYLSHDIISPTVASITGGLGLSCSLIVGPLVTAVVSSCGPRTALHIGVFLETMALVSASYATQGWQILLSQGACFGIGMGFLASTTINITSQWFEKKRSLANGIASSGCGIGGLIYSLATGAALSRVGLAWTLRMLAIVSVVVNIVCVNLLKDRNRAVGSRFKAFHLPLLRRPEFLLLLAFGAFTQFGYAALMFSLPDFAKSIGLTAQQGSVVSALHNLGQGIGRPAVGLASDRFGRLNTASLSTFLTALLIFVVWVFARNIGVLCLFALLSGAVSGIFWSTIPPLTVEVIGLPDLPCGLSIMWVVLVLPCTVSTFIALALRDRSMGDDAYLKTQVFIGLMYIGAAASLWIVRGWKVVEQELSSESSGQGETTVQGAVDPGRYNEVNTTRTGHQQSSAVSGDSVSQKLRPWEATQMARAMIRWRWI